jgi:hypothetical protein
MKSSVATINFGEGDIAKIASNMFNSKYTAYTSHRIIRAIFDVMLDGTHVDLISLNDRPPHNITELSVSKFETGYYLFGGGYYMRSSISHGIYYPSPASLTTHLFSFGTSICIEKKVVSYIWNNRKIK